MASKKTLTVIFIITAIIVVSITVWYFFIRKSPIDPNKSNTPTPSGSKTSKWVAEHFPLDIGMYGYKIQALQKALGITADGKFGPQTEGALGGYITPLSESDYDTILGISSSSPTTTSTISTTSSYPSPSAFAAYNGVILRNKDLSENYTANKDNWLGSVSGTSDDGSYYELDGTYYVIKNGVYLQ